MKQHLFPLLENSLKSLQQQGILPTELPAIQLERTRDSAHGDYACNIAMVLSKTARTNPKALADQIVAHLPKSQWVERTAIAGPGFINFFLTPEAFQSVVPEILSQGDRYGRSEMGAHKRIHLEFVSSNPTGPLHVGHGRSAAYGASLANLLEAAGFDVYREYYVNDAGRQMNILTTSLWLHYLKICGEEISFGDKYGYKGSYLIPIAEELYKEGKEKFYPRKGVFLEILNKYAPLTDEEMEREGGFSDSYTDRIITAAKELLGKKYDEILNFVLQRILDDIKDDLAEFGVHYQNWFSERSLFPEIEHALARLEKGGYLYKENNTTWFRSTDFGDDKDRVVIRENGFPTYFASDIAYLLNKRERGFQDCILVLGADHHGYIARFKAAYKALGFDPKDLEIPIVQFAVLYRGAERVQMSTRSGSFVTLRELRHEVGNDAARFFYVMRKCEQHLDFDLDLAKSRSNENPVYYIQYAHARICSVFRQLHEKKLGWEQTKELQLLVEPHERTLLNYLAVYPETIEVAAEAREPHIIANYLRELAGYFHAYYNAHGFLVDDVKLRNARLSLITAVQRVLANGLHLLGVTAPETM